MSNVPASPLASVPATRDALERHGLATKKALGQHFLISDGVVRHICELAELNAEDKVLEIGSGIGTLSCALLQQTGQVCAVERDTDLLPVLDETCAPGSRNSRLSIRTHCNYKQMICPFRPISLLLICPMQ